MVYDKFFLIFGNSEIRIRHNENKIYSNFGVNNSYFMCRDHKVDALLCEGKKNEVEFVNFEIYSI